MRDPVGSIYKPSDCSSGDEDRPEFIQFLDGREPQVHKVCTFGEDDVTYEVHLTSQVDIGAGFVGVFFTDLLTECWRRVPRFVRNPINGIVEWLGVPDFLRTDATACTANFLAPHPSWWCRGSSTNRNWGSQSGGDSDIVSIPWNRYICFLPVYHRRIF